MKTRHKLESLLFGALALLLCETSWAMPRTAHALTIDDVFATVTLERVSASPDGQWIAAVVQRPALDGEVFGRTAYEVDPSRNDVWLISRRTGERRNLTMGASTAAGFWCPTWSPDGRWLAMLSTKPEIGEPHGGNNVRLYVWDSVLGELRRLSSNAMMTQTRYGSPMTSVDLRGGARGTSQAQTCRIEEENAPFAWLDGHRLLAVTLPEGETSALLDQFGRPFDQSEMTRRRLREGRQRTVTAMGSGKESTKLDERANAAVLQVFDLRNNDKAEVGTIPVYPFQGALTLDIAPDGRKAAVLTPVAVFPPASCRQMPYQDDAWSVEKRLGFIDLIGGGTVRWVAPPQTAAYALELLGWSPDSTKAAVRARPDCLSAGTSLFVASAKSLSMDPIAESLIVGDSAAGPFPHDQAAHWTNDDQLLVRARPSAQARNDWWLVERDKQNLNLTAALAATPEAVWRTSAGVFVGLAGKRLVALDPRARSVDLRSDVFQEGAALALTDADGNKRNLILTTLVAGGKQLVEVIDLEGERRRFRVTLPRTAELLAFDHGSLIWRDPTPTGLWLHDLAVSGGGVRDLMVLNRHLADVRWGKVREIEYRSEDGKPLKGAVILPPDYQKGKVYPVITWVYSGFVVHDKNNYFTNIYMPGIYNLQLYAARGFVVLIPSMPFRRDAIKNDSYFGLTNGVIPAVNRLVELGIGDPRKVGLLGQSFGGYSVYSLVTQTNRFAAAVAMAGVTDLAQSYMQFDPLARGFAGIEHERSVMWSITEHGDGIGAAPFEDADIYRRNSPMSYVDKVETPLLLIHGELDIRASIVQAETFFSSLYRQGKTARLLRYWGESHSLAQSPANIRDIYSEITAWFRQYLRAGEDPTRRR